MLLRGRAEMKTTPGFLSPCCKHKLCSRRDLWLDQALELMALQLQAQDERLWKRGRFQPHR